MFDLKFANLPKTKDAEEFQQMFMTAFKPMQDYIKYNNLEDRLTPDDLHLFAHALAQGCMQWCDFLKMAKQQGRDRRDE